MTDAKQLLEELDRILLAEIEAYERLLELQQAEKRFAVEYTLEPFLANLQAKHHQASAIATLEKRRHKVLSLLAPMLHIPDPSVTLKQLSDRVDAPYATKFSHHRTRLQTLLADLQRVNRENDMLLRDSLACIEGALAFFALLLPDNLTYHQSGKFTLQTQGRLLCGKV